METVNSSTHLEPKLDSLTGQHVKLFPYARGYYPRDIIHRLWRLVEDEEAGKYLFHGRFGLTCETPVDTRADLLEFSEMFSQASRSLMLILRDTHKDVLAGFIWFDDIVPKFRATANVFIRRRYWGEPGREAGRLALGYMFNTLGVQYVWCYTPWHTAESYATAIGFKLHASLEDYCLVEHAQLDIKILRITKEEYNG